MNISHNGIVVAETVEVDLSVGFVDGYYFEDGKFRCGLSRLGKILGYSSDLFLPKLMTIGRSTVELYEKGYSFDFLSVIRLFPNSKTKKLEITESLVTITLQDATILIEWDDEKGNPLASNLALVLRDYSTANSLQKMPQESTRDVGVASLFPKQPLPASYYLDYCSQRKTANKESNRSKTSCFVYFILDQDRQVIKIGCSNDPQRRMLSLQTGNSVRLKLLGSTLGDERVERDLHERFKPFRVGGEWFRASEELLSFIKLFGTVD